MSSTKKARLSKAEIAKRMAARVPSPRTGRQFALLAFLATFAVAVSGVLMGASWDETYQNLLIKGIFQIGTGTAPSVTQTAGSLFVTGTAEVDGASRFDGATTKNSTDTCAGDVAKTSTTKNHFQITIAPSTTSTAVTGKSFGKATYSALLEPTEQVSRDYYVSSKSATGFTLNHPSCSTTQTMDCSIEHF